jgi:hypothetical protein
MCCLGFWAIQEGYAPGQISGIMEPEGLVAGVVTPPNGEPVDLWAGILDEGERITEVGQDIMHVNDAILFEGKDIYIEDWQGREPLETEEQREAILTRLFKSIGVEVEFV